MLPRNYPLPNGNPWPTEWMNKTLNGPLRNHTTDPRVCDSPCWVLNEKYDEEEGVKWENRPCTWVCPIKCPPCYKFNKWWDPDYKEAMCLPLVSCDEDYRNTTISYTSSLMKGMICTNKRLGGFAPLVRVHGHTITTSCFNDTVLVSVVAGGYLFIQALNGIYFFLSGKRRAYFDNRVTIDGPHIHDQSDDNEKTKGDHRDKGKGKAVEGRPTGEKGRPTREEGAATDESWNIDARSSLESTIKVQTAFGRPWPILVSDGQGQFVEVWPIEGHSYVQWPILVRNAQGQIFELWPDHQPNMEEVARGHPLQHSSIGKWLAAMRKDPHQGQSGPSRPSTVYEVNISAGPSMDVSIADEFRWKDLENPDSISARYRPERNPERREQHRLAAYNALIGIPVESGAQSDPLSENRSTFQSRENDNELSSRTRGKLRGGASSEDKIRPAPKPKPQIPQPDIPYTEEINHMIKTRAHTRLPRQTFHQMITKGEEDSRDSTPWVVNPSQRVGPKRRWNWPAWTGVEEWAWGGNWLVRDIIAPFWVGGLIVYISGREIKKHAFTDRKNAKYVCFWLIAFLNVFAQIILLGVLRRGIGLLYFIWPCLFVAMWLRVTSGLNGRFPRYYGPACGAWVCLCVLYIVQMSTVVYEGVLALLLPTLIGFLTFFFLIILETQRRDDKMYQLRVAQTTPR